MLPAKARPVSSTRDRRSTGAPMIGSLRPPAGTRTFESRLRGVAGWWRGLVVGLSVLKFLPLVDEVVSPGGVPERSGRIGRGRARGFVTRGALSGRLNTFTLPTGPAAPPHDVSG
jgi:hypothetical protein